ncbi:MAG: hypothetical protein DMF92_18270 [Acidobacteria bacterium]|nr:MAG: hypothetical protein DMF92_18270 [Acidobacteriota bacterium]
MSRRFLELLGVAAVLIAAVLLLKLARAPVGAAAQAQRATAGTTTKPGPAPTTPWGEPDLQGIWTRDSDEPLQRPARYAGKEFLTDEERAALDNQVSAIVGREAAESRRRRGTEQDVGGAYNSQIFTSHLRAGRRTSMIVDPPDGRIPPLTPEEQKRTAELRDYTLALLQATEVCKNKLPACAAGKYGPPSPRRAETPPHYLMNAVVGSAGGVISRSDGPEDRGHSERCMNAALPDFGGFRRIVQSRGQVSIFYDVGQGQGWERIIPITTAPHLPANVRLWWGDSRGRWEGKTLVIDVTNFSPKSNFQGAHENLHLVERWIRVDSDTLQYTVTIEDPTVWTKPWTATHELKRQSDEANRIYSEPRCHEGNYGMVALLSGARTAERAFAERRGPDPATLCLGGCGGFAAGFADEGADANPVR